MEIVSFFIGVFLGVISLSMNRIKLLVRVILSIITSYWFLKIINPSFLLWKLDDMKWKNIYLNFNYKQESILLFSISVITFYVLFPLLINFILKDKSIKNNNSFFFHLEESNTRKLKLICHKIVRLMINIRLKLGINFKQYNRQENLIEYRNDLISMSSIVIHFLVCWFFVLGFPSFLVSILMFSIFCFFLLNIFLTPFMKNIFYYMDKVFNHELNRHFKQFS